MGNCVETCRVSWRREEEEGDHDDSRSATVSKEESGLFRKDDNDGECDRKDVMRIKIVLTREELEWLMVQLSSNRSGEKRLEEALGEIERVRAEKSTPGGRGSGGRRTSWKPSLNSIMEAPEVQQMDG